MHRCYTNSQGESGGWPKYSECTLRSTGSHLPSYPFLSSRILFWSTAHRVSLSQGKNKRTTSGPSPTPRITQEAVYLCRPHGRKTAPVESKHGECHRFRHVNEASHTPWITGSEKENYLMDHWVSTVRTHRAAPWQWPKSVPNSRECWVLAGWSNNNFNDLHFTSSLDTNWISTCAAEQSFVYLKRRLFKIQFKKTYMSYVLFMSTCGSEGSVHVINSPMIFSPHMEIQSTGDNYLGWVMGTHYTVETLHRLHPEGRLQLVSTGERGSAPKGGVWKVPHLCSGSLMVSQSTPKSGS